MESFSTVVQVSTLEQIYHILKAATTASDSQSQKCVYNQLSSAQQNIQFYLGLASIAFNLSVELNIRQMALITLKSSLKRNINNIQFTTQQLDYFRECIVNGKYDQNEVLSNSQKALISVIALWNKQIDYQILTFIIDKISNPTSTPHQVNWGLHTLFIIFEDIKFQSENINCFEQVEFQQFVQNFIKIFAEKIKNQSNMQIIKKLIKCMNILLKYANRSHNQAVKQYVSNYLIPILSSNNFNQYLLNVILDGINQAISINVQSVVSLPTTLSIIANFNIENYKSEAVKRWLALILQLVDSDNQQQRMKHYLNIIIPKVLKNLVFTTQDEINIKMQMQQENNPYQYELDDQQQFQNDKSSDYGYTKRRLSAMILERLIVQYTEDVWVIVSIYMHQLLQSNNFVEKQCGVLMVGVIFQKIQDHLDFLEFAISIILSHINNQALPEILRCTSLWAIGKISYLIVREPALNQKIQQELVRCLISSNNQVKDTVYSTLDDLLQASDKLPQNLNKIVECMLVGIKNCKGKPLYCVLKTCSTLYQRFPNNIPEQITQLIVVELCSKWSTNSQIQSVMSPIIECLVVISSANPNAFRVYSFEIFKQCFKIIENVHHKTVILRVIDLLSSLVNVNQPQITQVLTENQQFHKRIQSLITSQQNQIRNFILGFIGDVCKVLMIPKFAERYIEIIGKNFDENNLTSTSNALTCLTDLILAHPSLGAKYAHNIMSMAIKKINVKESHKTYKFNFSRVFGRLGSISPVEGSLYIKQNLKILCSSLKAHQYQKLTDETYRGLFKIIEYNPSEVSQNFQYIVESFSCYPCQDKSVQNSFLNLLKLFRKSVTSQQWNRFVQDPIFLPAVSKKIETISV